MSDIDEKLLALSEEKYGEHYRPHLLEQYKLYVEMADRISTRRQSANSFFLAVNTALVALVTYVQLGPKVVPEGNFYWLVAIAGMALCYTWYRLIRSYRGMNSGKFKVIHRIEQQLPLSPYDAEWETLGRGENPDLYLQFTRIEMRVPWIFFVLHFIVFAQSIHAAVFSLCLYVLDIIRATVA